MTREKEIAILMEDRCTERDAIRHLKDGTVVYEDPKVYFQNLIGCGSYDGETIEDARAGKLAGVSVITYEGREYLIDYAL
jgi:hypothetical protein